MDDNTINVSLWLDSSSSLDTFPLYLSSRLQKFNVIVNFVSVSGQWLLGKAEERSVHADESLGYPFNVEPLLWLQTVMIVLPLISPEESLAVFPPPATVVIILKTVLKT